MVEEAKPPIEQIEEEIAWAAEAKITQAMRLAHEADKATRKRHASPRDRCDGSGDSVRLAHEADNAARKRHASPWDRCDGSGDSDEEVGDGTAFFGGGGAPNQV
jgi:hypothetical protein